MKLDKLFLLGKGTVALLCGECISQGAGILKNVTEKNVMTTGRDVGRIKETSQG